MSVFSVAALATDSANSTASNVTDEANSSEESVALSNNNNITCLTCRDGLISNTSSPGIINESAEVPDPDLPVINDTDIDATKTVSAMSSCSYVWIKITDKYCKGYKVYVDGVYQFTEGEGGVPDGYCCFKVTPGYHTFKLTLNGKEVSKGWNCRCGVVYNWVSMNDMIPHWCEDGGGGGDCDNPPTVSFDKTKYYEGDTVHATVSTIHGSVYYKIIDCYGTVRKTGYVSNGESIYYTIPSGASECCYWKICFYWDEGTPPLGLAGYEGDITTASYECTKCYSFYVCPHETPCKVWISVEDKYCKGYEVYVDGVYQFTEGESGTPDGYCRFWVTPGTHKFELRKGECSVSKSWYCQCGTSYRWISMNEMYPHWCECHKPTPPPVKEVKFKGTVTGTSPEGLIGAIHWYVSVDEWFSGSLPCDEIDVVIAMCPPFGSYDNSISKGDKVEVYGVVNPFGSDICTVGLNGESYYIKKIEEEKWDVKFQGTVTGTEDPYIEDFICEARVDKIISGAEYIEEGWTVNIILSAHDSPCGTYEEVKKGDKIEVFGQRLPVYCWPPQISLCGRSSYYLKKTEEKKANLIIQDLSWSPSNPKAGDKVTFAVTVKNQADRRINGEIDLYIDGEFKEGKGGETSAGYFAPGDTEVYHFDWTAEPGTHTIKFVTNPDDMLTGENGEDEKSISFDISSEEHDVKFQGKITNIFNKYDHHYYDANIKVTKIINDPSGTLYVGKTVTVKRTNEDAYEDEVEIGDQVEVNAGYDSRYSYYSVGRWQDYIKKLEIPSETTVKFRGAIKNTFNKLSDYWYDADITVTEILDDPSGSLYIGKTVTIKRTSGDACEDPVNIGDEVQVYAVCKNNHYSIRKYEHYIKKLIEGERSDLIIQDISWSPADPKIGNTIEFWITVKNQGIDSAEKFNVVGDMCEPIKKSKGIPFRFFDFDVPSLAAGEEYTYTATYKPEIRGEYYLEVVADNWHEIKEIEENNNKVKVSFTVSDKPKEVKFIGTYLYVFNPMGFNAYHFSVDKVLEGKDIAGDKTQIIISEVRETPEAIKELKEGDKVEIYGKVKNYYEGAWIIDIEGNGYYIKGKPKGKQEIKFIGTFEYSRSIWNGGAQQYFFSVDKILRGNGITCSQADIVIPVREPNEKLDAISQILKTLKKGDKVLIYAELKSQVMICDLGFSSDKHFVHRYSTDLNTQYLEQVANFSKCYNKFIETSLDYRWWAALTKEEYKKGMTDLCIGTIINLATVGIAAKFPATADLLNAIGLPLTGKSISDHISTLKKEYIFKNIAETLAGTENHVRSDLCDLNSNAIQLAIQLDEAVEKEEDTRTLLSKRRELLSRAYKDVCNLDQALFTKIDKSSYVFKIDVYREIHNHLALLATILSADYGENGGFENYWYGSELNYNLDKATGCGFVIQRLDDGMERAHFFGYFNKRGDKDEYKLSSMPKDFTFVQVIGDKNTLFILEDSDGDLKSTVLGNGTIQYMDIKYPDAAGEYILTVQCYDHAGPYEIQIQRCFSPPFSSNLYPKIEPLS